MKKEKEKEIKKLKALIDTYILMGCSALVKKDIEHLNELLSNI